MATTNHSVSHCGVWRAISGVICLYLTMVVEGREIWGGVCSVYDRAITARHLSNVRSYSLLALFAIVKDEYLLLTKILTVSCAAVIVEIQ